MDERKRHLSDSFEHTSTSEGGSSGNTPPPSKKHASLMRGVASSGGMAISTGLGHEMAEQETARTSQPVSPYTTITNGPSDTPTDSTDGQEKSSAEKLLQFQKEAIWRQMQEYKRECQRMEGDLERVESSRQHFYLLAGRFDGFWHEIQNELQKSSDATLANGNSNSVIAHDFLDQQAMRCMDEEAWSNWLENKKTYTSTLLQNIVNYTKQMSKDRDDIIHHITVLDEAAIIDMLKKENTRLKSEKELISLSAVQTQLHETKRQNDELRFELKRAERAVDRLKSTSELPVAASPASEPYTADKANPQTSNPALQAPTDVASISENGHLEAVQRLADNRLQELCQVKDDKVRLMQEIDYLRMQLNEVERQRVTIEALQAELEELKSSRRQYMEQVQTEEKKRREVLESELRRLENDLTRVRGNRDHLQQQLELRCSKDNTELVQHQEIRVIANTRKIAADSGDREAFDFHSVNEELSLVEHLRGQLKQQEEQMQVLKQENDTYKSEIASFSEDGHTEIEKLLTQQAQLNRELVESNERARKLDEKYKAFNDASDPFMNCTESQLMSEIENISKEWFQLEESSSRKILDIAAKEDQIVQLLAEKTKYDQKYGMLHKQKDSLSNVNIALRRQSEKQEHEKNLDQQLANLERELASVNTALQQFKERLAQTNRQLEETTEKISKSDGRFTELQNLLKERTQSCEDAVHARRRLAEERDTLQQRVDQLTRQLSGGPDVGNEETERLLEEYKTLLKCGSCNLRFKSHVLSRCMHVFCKECIDSRIETRQRKCPICGDAFGVNDVRQVYL
ncbi:hypothetical protein BDF22DRAFT_744686 [Syncephalis plumigaleata]|nr:hypothetical protein BDF22DRAFT_744686 [Syncephalis plumigaleata]